MLRKVSAFLYFRIGAQTFASKKPTDPPPAKITKHNPNGDPDLRGFEQLEDQNEKERTFSNQKSNTYDNFAAYSLFSHLPYSPTHAATQ